ncbi:hypothetical protein AKJ09_03893 [Labilithrix luteola]|uniref:Uncharacterized protein n=1 Tax=Labilithrix luteola TaxID=1391654 RepID=A0A0K1PVT9_9BACT|nr:hypothetical protein AKJ09_03893 [Labilithrix luteola]
MVRARAVRRSARARGARGEGRSSEHGVPLGGRRACAGRARARRSRAARGGVTARPGSTLRESDLSGIRCATGGRGNQSAYRARHDDGPNTAKIHRSSQI